MSARPRIVGAALWVLIATSACSDEAVERSDDDRTRDKATGGVGEVDAATNQASDDDSPVDAAQEAPADAGAPAAQAQLDGRFVVSLIDEDPINGTPALSNMQGHVRSGPPLERMGWQAVKQAGSCRLETPTFPFCDPDCERRSCVVGDVCSSEPSAASVGTVTVAGLTVEGGATEITLSEIGARYVAPGSVNIQYPPSAKGAELHLTASGGAYGPFEIRTTGIAPLEITSDGKLPLDRDRGLAVEWIPESDGATEVSAIVDISHHGGVKGRILCDAEDGRGTLNVAAELVSALIDLGVSGFPVIRVARRAVGVTTTDNGSMRFSVEQNREIGLEIPGLTSCLEQADCPQDQVCMFDKRCG